MNPPIKKTIKKHTSIGNLYEKVIHKANEHMKNYSVLIGEKAIHAKILR